MIIKSIDTAGAINTLRWAVSKSIPIFNNPAIIRFIEPETYFTLTLSDVTMLEVYLLAQHYRNKMWIIKEDAPEMPNDEELEGIFPGEIKSEDGTVSVTNVNLAKSSILQFINIYKQMLGDFDIIQQGVAIEFAPMISRRFEIRIPISFTDMISTTQGSKEDTDKLIQAILANNLNEFADSYDNIGRLINVIFVKSTNIPLYEDSYISCLETIKYAPLKKIDGSKLYRFKLTGLSRFDDEKHIDHILSMFQGNKKETIDKMQDMGKLDSAVRAEFAIELPLHHQLSLLNSFSSEELPIRFESSMKQVLNSIERVLDIVHTGIKSEQTDLSNPEDPAIAEYQNRLENYSTRVEEAISMMLGVIQKLIEQNGVCDLTSIFALLPGIVMTRSIIEVNSLKIGKFLYHNTDDITVSMFNDMAITIDNIKTQLK